jgi:nucleotide-binding universal stress UspA family protein
MIGSTLGGLMNLSQILVAVDGSKHSEKIVDYSSKLAKKLSSSIILIYVSPYPDLVNQYMEIGGRAPAPRAVQYVQKAEDVTSKLAEKIEEASIPYEVFLETGDPAEMIVRKAFEKHADMIMVGLTGLHGVDKIRSLGSVARRVIETAPCPVVVVTGGY